MADTFPEIPVTCINCNAENPAPYCAFCGQRAEVPRLTLRNIAVDMQERLFGVDGRFPRTFIEAWKNPGQMSRSFIAGNRRRYIGPVGFFFILLTVYLLSFRVFGLDISDLVKRSASINVTDNASQNQVEFAQQLSVMFASSFKALSFFSVFLTGVLLWLFNRRMKMNVTEHLVFSFYTEGIGYLLSIMQVVFMAFNDPMFLNVVSFFFTFLYFIYAYTTYDLKGSLFRRIIKALAIRILASLIIGILVVLGMIIFALSHPELF